MIDGGPPGSETQISACLEKLGVERLDTVVVTHPHLDHIGGLPELIDEYRPRRAVMAGGADTACYASLVAALKRTGTRIKAAFRGATLRFGRLKARVLSPGKDLSGDANEDSITLLLVVQKKRILLTGDLTGPNEDRVGEICARGPPLYLLKVAHHGSRHSTSTAFLSQTEPKFAVICVGPNSYGHPTPVTLARLRSAGTRVYTTQKKGTVTVTIEKSGKAKWKFSK